MSPAWAALLAFNTGAARLVSPLATGSFLVEASPDPVHEALNTGAFDVVITHPLM